MSYILHFLKQLPERSIFLQTIIIFKHILCTCPSLIKQPPLLLHLHQNTDTTIQMSGGHRHQPAVYILNILWIIVFPQPCLHQKLNINYTLSVKSQFPSSSMSWCREWFWESLQHCKNTAIIRYHAIIATNEGQ